MAATVRQTASFPTACIAPRGARLPIQVTLVAQLGHGAGDRLYRDACARQQGHGTFSNELDEPAAILAGANPGLGETTAVHSFAVGPQGHPFHRHAGHRVFTAVSGSGGTQLRFSTAEDAELHSSPRKFFDSLQFIDVPPDCLFTVRFGGGTWHQFVPLRQSSVHPTLFALSCHTNELAGIDDLALRQQVGEGKASIHDLTELLPANVEEVLRARPLRHGDVPRLALSLNERPGSLLSTVCGAWRRVMGRVRVAAGHWRGDGAGFVGRNRTAVVEYRRAPVDSLLSRHLAEDFHHEDTFELVLHGYGETGNLATSLLADVLEGFLVNRPTGVSWLMRLRNLLVRPLGLRTSPLGCPASSLLSGDRERLFAGRFPVLDQTVDPQGAWAEVLLGANDRHLQFRSCVGVRFVGADAHVSLGTRVKCLNTFGRFYMTVIDKVHRAYIAPVMLDMAAEHAQRRVHQLEGSTVMAF